MIKENNIEKNPCLVYNVVCKANDRVDSIKSNIEMVHKHHMNVFHVTCASLCLCIDATDEKDQRYEKQQRKGLDRR